MRQTLKRMLSFVLVVALFISAMPTGAFAVERPEVRIPEITIGDDILDYDVFYLATAAASIPENGNSVYLLRVGRGGPADSESTALIKIADMTAKYGEDYIVRVHDEKTKVDDPEDNFSLMEMIEDSDFTQTPISDSDEFADMMENDPDAQAAYQEGVEAALDFLEEESGLKDKYGDENPYADALKEQAEDTEPADAGDVDGGDNETAEPAEDADPAESEGGLEAEIEAVPDEDKGAIPADDSGEIVTIGGDDSMDFDPVQQAANLFTGQNATAQRLTTEGDMFQDLQAVANVMTNAVVGASVNLTFAEGETEKYLEIVPKDNRTGDGDRMFYIILGAPSGTTTNSSASACAFTIVDDEEQEPATVNFSATEYRPEAGAESVTVTVNRSGAMNTVVSARVKTTGEGTAEMGRDYSEVDSELVFPFGVDHLSLEIPVRTEYLSGAGDFELALVPTAGCETGDIGTATVTIDGSYTTKANLLSTQSAKMMSASSGTATLMAASGTVTDRNNLATFKTLDAIDISSPFLKYTYGQSSVNKYNSSGSWEMMYAGSSSTGGPVEAYFELTNDYWTSYFLSGAQVNWNRTYGGSDKAIMKVTLAGSRPSPYSKYPFGGAAGSSFDGYHYYTADLNEEEARTTDWVNNHVVYWHSYWSNREFTNETRYIYPSLNAMDPSKQARYTAPDGTNAIFMLNDYFNEVDEKKSLPSLDEYKAYKGYVESSDTSSMNTWRTNHGFSTLSWMDAWSNPYKGMDTLVNTYGAYLDYVDIVEKGGFYAVYLANNWRDTHGYEHIDESTFQSDPYKGIEAPGQTPQFPHLNGDGGPMLGGDHPQAIGFQNSGQCKDCNILYINSITPILRPFQVNRINGDNLPFLKEDGSRSTITNDTASSATIAEGGSQVVLFKDDSFTMEAVSGSNVNQYTYMSALNLMDGANENKVLYTLATNNNSANTSITYTLNTANMEKMIKAICPDYAKGETQNWFNLLQENPQARKDDGYATFVKFNVKPQFDYVDASVTLRNPYDFPVTMTISGTDYTLAARETRKINAPDGKSWHKGDCLAIKKISLGSGMEESYTVTGVWYQGKYNSTSAKFDKDGDLNFLDYATIYVGGSDNRLNFGEVVIEPRVQAKSNTIRVRVKTSELGNFDRTIERDSSGNVTKHPGVLATQGTVSGEYTYFTFADANNTVNGKSYAITATPLNSNMVSVWYDANTYRYYEGNTLYFTAGAQAERNIITLSAESTSKSVTIQGTLKYNNFNLRTNSEGSESNVPATGATIAAGSAGGVANNDGFVTAGPIPTTGKANRYLRYFVSVNGSDMLKETLLPQTNGSNVVDISSNFPKGVSAVTSAIFKDIQIEGTMSDSAYQIEGSTIPVVQGKTANLSVRVRPQSYVFSMLGKDGNASKIYEDKRTESPISVQLVVYDANDVFRGAFEPVSTSSRSGGYYVFSTPMEYVQPEELTMLLDGNGNPVYDSSGNPIYVKVDENGNPMYDSSGNPITAEPSYGLIPDPGDKLYLRLVTDRLAQVDTLRTADDKVIDDYRYSDVFTGYTFRQPVAQAVAPKVGIKDPIEVEYGSLPLISDTGLDLGFPFVNIGIMRIAKGYRIYFGVSPVQIADTIKGSHMSSMSGADGQYWKSLFSIKSPFQSFSDGFAAAKKNISNIREAAKDAAANNEKFDVGSLGAPSWKFDISVGMYFDFTYCTIKQGQSSASYYKFDGLGGYVSISLGFSMTWYTVLPVVFLPAYFGIELGGTVMGFLGADFNSKVDVSYDDSLNGSANINDGITSLNGGIRGSAYVQISLGIGLCGTLGIRASGRVNMIANWEPTDPHGSWGFYVGLQAGVIIDLFLFSVPLMFTVAGWPFGSFEYYANPDKWKETYSSASLMSASEENTGTFQLREGSGEDSLWLGDQMLVMGAFRPNKTKEKILAADAYERSDARLITLSDGKTLALAFIDSDTAKGDAQRTTLKLSIYNTDTGLWSEPVPVSADNTADFQPSIGEMKDGRLLVAWVSPTVASNVDLSTDEGVMAYLNSMEVYAAFITLENGQIKTKTDNGVTVADTEITQITNDHYTQTVDNVTTISSYYDSNPTVVCDMESGDAMVYYIKSGRSSLGDGQIIDYINPYTNDCVVCYMPYNAAADTNAGTDGTSDGVTVPAGWLTNYFYDSELSTSDSQGRTRVQQAKILIDNFGGQRFLDGALNEDNERYTIPDFAAVAYNGLAIYAYTVDIDGSNDTDTDKELYLQVYDFTNHETKYKIQLTDDKVSDTMPQFFRSKVNTAASGGQSTDAENTHTKLFWYRDGKEVVYIDVTALLRDGINDNGTLKTKSNGGDANTEYTYVLDGKTYYRYTDPHSVWFVSDTDSHASLSQPDFKAVEDSEGNLYVLWTEGVTDENGKTAQEIFGTGLVGYETTTTGENGATETTWASSGWSKPYQITRDGYNNDEIAVAMSGENLIVVHNRFTEELVVPETTQEETVTVTSQKGKPDETTYQMVAEYNGQVDFMPIKIDNMCLVADTLEPCGSVETESITLNRVEVVTYTDEDGNKTTTEQNTPVTQPVAGENVSVEVEIANNGMNVAQGYRLTLYAGETIIGSLVSSDALAPNSRRTHSFTCTLPSNVDGLVFKAVTQEMRYAHSQKYYDDTDTYLSDPLTAEAVYEITGTETYQDEDGFHAKFTVKNTGNAASSADDTLNIQLWGPANLANLYPDEKGSLHSEKISLGIGQTKEFDVPVSITPEMIKEYGFVTTRVAVQKEVVEQVLNGQEYKGTQFLSNLEYVYFDLVQPMNMELANVSVAANSTADISFSMDLGDTFQGGDRVTYALEDNSIARLQDGKVLGVSAGTTTLYATHAATGATVASTVTVTNSSTPTPTEITVEVSSDEGAVSVTASVSGNTATITAPTDAQMEEITGKGKETGEVTIDLSSLPDTVTAVAIPAETVKAIDEAMEAGGEGLTVKLPNSTVTFDADALESIAEQTTGSDLKLNVEPITESKLNAKQREALTDLDVQAVYDVYLTSGGKRISDFGGGKASVEVTHTVKDGQKPGGIAVWYVAEAGGKTRIPTTTSEKTVRFTVSHFSDYVLTYDETLPGACEKDDTCPMTGFTDLDKSKWYHDGVHWALEEGVMSGYGGGRFGPNDTTTRAQIVQMLWNLEGKPKTSHTLTFKDVASDKWYTEAIRWASEKKLVSGYSSEKFGPDDKLTREQLATILNRYAKYKGMDTSAGEKNKLSGFTDAQQISSWAEPSFRWAVDAGIISGVGGGRLSPKTDASRAQVATMLMRYEIIAQ